MVNLIIKDCSYANDVYNACKGFPSRVGVELNHLSKTSSESVGVSRLLDFSHESFPRAFELMTLLKNVYNLVRTFITSQAYFTVDTPRLSSGD